MISRLLVPVSILAVIGLSPLSTAAASGNCIRECAPPAVHTVSNGYTYSYDAASRTFLGVETFGVAGAAHASYAVRDVIDCGIVAPPDGGAVPPGGLDCQRAMCRVGPRAGRWIVVWYRETAPVVAAGWTIGGRHCQAATDPIPLQAVDDAAAEHLRQLVEPAVPIVQPGAVTLVNFPTIVSTRDPGPVAFGIDLPLPGAVAVTPSFTWTFTDPDGSTSTAVGTGRAFDGTRPSTPDHYLTKVFTAPGTATVSVTETWAGTVTVDGVGPVALDPLPLTRAVALTVRENRPVLVGQ